MGITNAGLSEVAGLLGNTGSKTAFGYVATGSGSTAFAATQTKLVSENTLYSSGRAAASVALATTTVANDTTRFTKTWAISGGTVTVRELAIFNNSSGGTMLARKVLDADKSIASGESYSLTYDVITNNA